MVRMFQVRGPLVVAAVVSVGTAHGNLSLCFRR